MLEPRVQALAITAGTLVGNGHLTSSTIEIVEDLGRRLGVPVHCLVKWSEVTLVDDDGQLVDTVPVQPEGIAMSRVSATLAALAGLPENPGDDDVATLVNRLDDAAKAPASPTWLFVVACITGACALGFIFGAHTPAGLGLIALAAGLGGWIRRLLAAHCVAVPGQALAAALIGGVIGGLGAHVGVTSAARLVAVCPAMVLVPGPHLINGVLDIVARHVSIGWHRLLYGTTILIAISGGLVVGLFAAGSDLPTTAPGATVPLVVDALAGAVAAGSYPVYFSMPRRQIGWPVVIGGIAHAVRWVLITRLGTDAVSADFVACLLVGLAAEPVARARHLSFAGIGFAGVVALVPGMYVFRTVAGMFALTTRATSAQTIAVAGDLSTAVLLLGAIAFGLVVAHGLTRPRKTRQ